MDLGTYEGLGITATSVAIRNAGDGLSAALQVDPVKLDLHATVHVVLECEVTKHSYEEVKDDPAALTLVNVLRAGRATLIDGDAVREALDAQHQRIAEAKAKADEERRAEQGEQQLPLDAGDALDQGIAIAEEADGQAEWRRARTRELDAFDKPRLVVLAADYGIPGRTKLTKSELVDAIADHEDVHQQGDEADVPF